MKEYIERTAVEKFIEDGLNNPDKNKAFGHDAIEIMAEVHYMPAADVAEVVRCKDCIYRINGRCFSRTSFINSPAVEPDDFCCWGATE